MFGFFKNKKKEKAKPAPQLIDLKNNPLAEGDMVESLRYGLGKCRIVMVDGMAHYESLETGEKVIWLKMIDAATDLQKVVKVSS